MNVTRVPVLIVGAGAAGLAASALLAKHDVRSMLIEKRREVFSYPKARNLSFRTSEILRGLGLADEVHAVGEHVSDMVAKQALNSPVEHPAINIDAIFAGLDALSPEPSVRYCPQSRLEPILLAKTRRQGNEVRYGTELSSFEQDDFGVTAVARDLDTQETWRVRADYLLAADGVHSRVRKSLDVTTSGYGALPIYVVFIYFRGPWRRFVPHLGDGDGIQIKNSDVDGILLSAEGDLGMFITTYFPDHWRDSRTVHTGALSRGAAQGSRRADRDRRRRHGRLAAVRAGSRPIPGRTNAFRRRLGAHHAAVQGGRSQCCDSERTQSGVETGRCLDRDGRSGVARHLPRRASSDRAVLGASVTERTVAAPAAPRREEPATAAGGRSTDVQPAHRISVRLSGGGSRRARRQRAVGRRTAWTTRHPRPARLGLPRRQADLDARLTRLRVHAADGGAGDGWFDAAAAVSAALGVAVDVHRIGADGDVVDPDGAWAAVTGLGPGGAVLVRPDDFVGWRVDKRPEHPEAELRQVLSTILDRTGAPA
jgi:putative polyketide hydroxylase